MRPLVEPGKLLGIIDASISRGAERHERGELKRLNFCRGGDVWMSHAGANQFAADYLAGIRANEPNTSKTKEDCFRLLLRKTKKTEYGTWYEFRLPCDRHIGERHACSKCTTLADGGSKLCAICKGTYDLCERCEMLVHRSYAAMSGESPDSVKLFTIIRIVT